MSVKELIRKAAGSAEKKLFKWFRLQSTYWTPGVKDLITSKSICINVNRGKFFFYALQDVLTSRKYEILSRNLELPLQ